MFNRKTRLGAIAELEADLAAARRAVDQLTARNTCIGVRVSGRSMTLDFMVNGRPVEIETYATMAIDIDQLRVDLGIEQ